MTSSGPPLLAASPDPSKATGSEEEQLVVYRSVRDAIRKHIEAELLTTGQPETDDIPA